MNSSPPAEGLVYNNDTKKWELAPHLRGLSLQECREMIERGDPLPFDLKITAHVCSPLGMMLAHEFKDYPVLERDSEEKK